MRFTYVILTACLCLTARAETTATASEKDSDEAIVAAAEKLVAEDPTVKKAPEAAPPVVHATSAVPSELSKDINDESHIPVFSKSQKVAKSESSLLWRLFASLAFLAIVGVGLIVAGRKWTTQKTKGGDKARIEVLHQYHLGPKKSLVLIRVAGEGILLGCTDHTINCLKTITLIDDELENALGGANVDFNRFLEDEFSIEDARTALTARA